MSTALAGWAAASRGECLAADGSPACTLENQLLRTDDGGRTWRPVTLPTGAASLVSHSVPEPVIESAPGPQVSASAVPRTRATTGQGFDSCTLPLLSHMEDWITNSPYRVWNLYLGGSARGNCGRLTAAYLATLAVQGWRFIPTWVGPLPARRPRGQFGRRGGGGPGADLLR
jgi:hypothetical protein